jgi:signal transduction histidine kinase
MKNDQNSSSGSLQLEELQAQISALQQKLDQANVINQAMWSLLVEISKRLQVSSAAIKAAVSSLLGYDIFWDGSTQHELLEIIDDSADQVSNQIMLLSLAFRSESNSLEVKPEPNEIQEILSSVLDTIVEGYPELKLDIDMLSDGNPVLVDYEYLSVALKLLFEVLAVTQKAPQRFKVIVSEAPSDWYVDIYGASNEILDFISTIPLCLADELTQETRLLPANKLKLLVMCRIFGLQSIQIGTITDPANLMGLRLSIPLVKKS